VFHAVFLFLAGQGGKPLGFDPVLPGFIDQAHLQILQIPI
jgi:hypothetical protein